MWIKNVTISRFRSYLAAAVEFSPGVNVITGGNAQGKTNLLEAVHLLSIGRSMRTPRLHELIRFGESSAAVRGEAEGLRGQTRVELSLLGKDKRRVTINGMPVAKLGELMGAITTVLFSPDEIEIIKAAPRLRRRFLDVALCQTSRVYFYALARYNKVLNQRNRLLKSGESASTLDVWDLQLASYGAKVIDMRRSLLKKLAGCAAAAHGYLTSDTEVLTLGYEGIDGGDEAEISENFKSELKRTRDKDVLLRFTHAGPQSDDFWIQADGVDIRRFGSQGQQRTAALSLKLAELDLYKQEQGEYPVLLLDDVFSELDSTRQGKLKARLNDFQTLITCTDAHTEPFAGAKYIRIDNGQIIYI